jgi:hypothetical protein
LQEETQKKTFSQITYTIQNINSMTKFLIIIYIFISISCTEKNTSQINSTLDSVTIHDNNLISNTGNPDSNKSIYKDLIGIWNFQKAVLASEDDSPDKEKLLLVNDKTIEIIDNLLIVESNCRSEIVIDKISSLNYWGNEKNLAYQKISFKRAGLNLPDSILTIKNIRDNEGCSLPFSELLYFDDKIISTMYPYVIVFKKSNEDCFSSTIDLHTPFVSKDIKNLKIRHNMQCTIKDLEKFRCGNDAIQYYKLGSNNEFTYLIFPQDCGDSEFSYFLILKENKIIDELIIDKIAETEVNENRGLEYTHCIIDSLFNIRLTNSIWIEGQEKEQYVNDEFYFINDIGNFIKK